nr:glucose-1-phosphate cytidylyltransferase [uncultured Sphingomonas sp.]
MKAMILAGGLGTRLAEETSIIPKPLVEIGSEPILWHIMKMLRSHGIREFIVCCGYKSLLIKRYFEEYRLRALNVTYDLATSSAEYHQPHEEDWRVTLLDTGLNTMTGGRLKRAAGLLDGEPFLMTYGDGVGNIDITSLTAFHRAHGKLATVTAVQPTGRFGAMYLTEEDPHVRAFKEKPEGDGTWISGGFFILQPRALDLIDGDDTVWEHGPMNALTDAGELVAYRHPGFWHPMDTLRDKTVLNDMWNKGAAPWRTW